MPRTSHIIRKNITSTSPDRWIFFDVETMPIPQNDNTDLHKLRLGVALYWNKTNKKPGQWFRFTEIHEFWEWVFSKLKKKGRLILLAHNSDFDFRTLQGFKVLSDNDWIPQVMIIEAPPYLLKYRKNNCTLEVLDTLNYFRMSLAAMGEMIGVAKYDMPEWSATDEEWFEYCERDVHVLAETWKSYLRFFELHDMGTFGKTRAAQSFNWYCHRFMHTPIHVHNFPDVTRIERDAYFGGRTECFFLGSITDSDMFYLDINSQYPYVMQEELYPHEYVRRLTNLNISELTECLDEYLCVAEVLISTDKPFYPKRYNDRLCFPVGQFWTALCTPELKLALKNGHIKSTGRVAMYRGANIFEAWVKELYQLRVKLKAEGNTAYQDFVKYLMNSLYGKFGQHNEEWELMGYEPERETGVKTVLIQETGEMFRERTIEGYVYKSMGKHEWRHSFPAISAHVTSYARMLLLDYMNKAGNGNFYYCDTDSLIVNEQGFRNLLTDINPTKLGALDLEQQGRNADFRNLKDYTFGDESKRKGLSKKAVQLGENTFRMEVFEKFKGALLRKRLDAVYVRQVIKHYSKEYNKGTVQSDGSIQPYTLSETRYPYGELHRSAKT